MESLEKFQRKCLRQIQGLPDKTPNCVTLSLLGIPPVELIIRVGSHVVFAWIHCTDVRIHCTDILIECR